MTTALVIKKAALKGGLPMKINSDGVVVLNPGASAVYQIDSTTGDGQSVQFSGAVQGVTDVSYGALYTLAKTAFPAEFP